MVTRSINGNEDWRQTTKGQWERESTRQGLDATSDTKFTAMRPPYSLSPRCYSGFQRRNARVVVVFFSGTNHPVALRIQPARFKSMRKIRLAD